MSGNEPKRQEQLGLNWGQVEESRRQYGSNEITRKKAKSFGRRYLESFGDPTIKILLVVLALNVIFFLRNFDWYESVGIAISILVATLVSTMSEHGSQVAFDKLMADASRTKCKIWRGNVLEELPVTDVVVGDYVKLQAGDRIPADGILIQGNLEVDQSALNGETKEAHKTAAPYLQKPTERRRNLLDPHTLFSGSVVCEGEGILWVQYVGDATFYGDLAKELQIEDQESPLKRRLADLAKTISKFGYMGAALVFCASLFESIGLDNHFVGAAMLAHVSDPYRLLGDLLKAIALAVTVIVVAVPEGLPLMITVVLSSNMKKMVKDNVLVRKLVGIETAGSLNILFTDKTGTLTEGKLSVASYLNGDGTELDTPRDLQAYPNIWEMFYISSVYNNSSQLGHENGRPAVMGGNSTDRALLEFAVSGGLPQEKSITVLSTIPFKSENKYAAARIAGDWNTTLLKGAPEKIVSRCRYYYDMSGKKREFTAELSLRRKMKDMSSRGIRLLALAVSDAEVREKTSFPELTLIGIVGIRDKARKSARDSIRQVTGAGVQVVMVTGDGKDTAAAIAREIGLVGSRDPECAIMTSDELNRLSDEQVKRILPSLRVVARALPGDKSRLVRVAGEMGLVTGMTGDGVNDAPALKKADVGFAMGSGSEVAKEAGDIIILDNNFLSIGNAILYGRTIFKSIRKFIIYQLSSNVCAVGISIVGHFIGIDTPITVIQMLWVNMVMDTLSSLAFAGEPPLAEYMEEKPKRREDKIINRYMASQIGLAGGYTMLLSIAFYKLPLLQNMFRSAPDQRYLLTGFFGFFMFSFIFNALNARTPRINLLANIWKNKAFLGIMGMTFAIQLGLIYLGGPVFRAYGLTAKELAFVILLALSIIPVDLIRKIWLRRKSSKEEIARFL
ncbi:calcium-translocating P-type ATPase, PMCA-type [Bianquea renquensis]|uniref:P-type Ca(2+) transporter n=1 Tax=Bianquea renquensis TaxID=2763661 RepID=A0A926I0Z0_9FIRM|nr:calcium-translocating P-type ATPase, PMCA-type [Bianquea renquensis]MBC8542943.1 calcium-translocating P-type ATPase, PMCA-type [Bianquea renquensis]